jgi:hypothetical protein
MAIDLNKFSKGMATGSKTANKPLGASIPDGKHRGQIKSIDIKETKNGDPQVSFRIGTLGYSEPLFKNHVLKDTEAAERLGKDLATMGVVLPPDNANALFEEKDKLVGAWINFEKKTKPDGKGGEWINIYINKLIDAPDEVEIAEANAKAEAQKAAASDDDDIPF